MIIYIRYSGLSQVTFEVIELGFQLEQKLACVDESAVTESNEENAKRVEFLVKIQPRL